MIKQKERSPMMEKIAEVLLKISNVVRGGQRES